MRSQRATIAVIAYVISASGGVGFDLDARDASYLVCHRQCGGEDNSGDMVAGFRACECALQNSPPYWFSNVRLRCRVPRASASAGHLASVAPP